MIKIIQFIITAFCISVAQAKDLKPPYQVDLIVFTHQKNTNDNHETPYFLNNQQTILLKNNSGHTNAFYQLLPSKASRLQREYYSLNHKPQYQVLLHYSWLQPANNQQSIRLPIANHNGWEVQGTLRLRQSNYYLLDTKLKLSRIDNSQSPIIFEKNERMKEDIIYYLDHPQAGMLIKVHKLT